MVPGHCGTCRRSKLGRGRGSWLPIRVLNGILECPGSAFQQSDPAAFTSFLFHGKHGGGLMFGNRELGFVWQIHSLLAEFTAPENVMMPLLIRGQSQEQAGAFSLARLEEIGLRNRATHRAGERSVREQQGVVLARALVEDRSVLLADEPTGSLDFRPGEMMMGL